MAVWSILLEILKRPTFGDVVIELVMFMIPLWIAVIVGVLVGWAWKPKWANLGRVMFDSSVSKDSATTVASPASLSISTLNSLKFQLPSFISWVANDGIQKDSSSAPPSLRHDFSSSQLQKDKSGMVNEDDLELLCKLVEDKDGGPAWIQMMDRSSPTMSYQAWRRDPETGPTQYRTRTVFEDATPEMFPFFCSDREYIIGRRIWESGRLYYCITKGVPCSSLPRRNKPRRVDLYYSSWCIRAVESKSGDGQLTACEVLLFHHEDMGIPLEIAKLGIRHGMWGAVKKIEPSLRAYQKQRAAGDPLSRCAFMAQINTKVSADYLKCLESTASSHSSEVEIQDSSSKKPGETYIGFW
ncbi:hypothetical protein GH714_010846 [Hevea brasiliensis]|uniref:START domain-containing protein n=1 Tax=Hevea brasiliensis TaxID=3981 RepID=A0A6A6LBX8_HEVBR|nr:hypothetical protein GH714_010846 [Hevea brasiliensis]